MSNEKIEGQERHYPSHPGKCGEPVHHHICPPKPCPPQPCTCPLGQCQCPPGQCQCPPGQCQCPADKCQCPADKCQCPADKCQCPADKCQCDPATTCKCPPGSCTCPEGTCPQTTELVQNPSFEIPCTVTDPITCNVFASWFGTNIAIGSSATNAPLTGNAAAILGAANNQDATLTQTVSGIKAGCPYKFSFSVNAQGLSNGTGIFTADVIWLPSNTPAINPLINPIKIDGRLSGNNYVFIQRVTNLAPAGTTGAQIIFTKTGTGSVLVDDVSLHI